MKGLVGLMVLHEQQLRRIRPVRYRYSFVAVLVLAVFTVVMAGCAQTSPQQNRPPEPAASTPAEVVPPETHTSKGTGPYVLPAVVTRVIDGDTVYVRFKTGREEKVRFIGVDTPESTREVEPYGKEAAAYTRKRLLGKTVYLELDVAERDKYGRVLAYVWLAPPKTGSEAEVRQKMFNAELLLAGLAQVMTVPPNVKYADFFLKLQAEARKAEKGLWRRERR